MMNYSYTQISQYLTCPRRYRHRYLDGWQEKDVRAAMLFGRCFEQAVAALFRHEDPAAVLFEQWAPCKDLELAYSGSDTWDHMLRQGIQLLERFTQDGRVQIHQPQSHQQIRFTRTLSSGNSFVAFVDAVGELDGTPCVLEWKTASARYPEEPNGIAALDPQLVCYSWMTGINEVAQVVFVRSARWKSSTCEPPSPTNSARSSKPWSTTRYVGLSQDCSCRTAAFASPRTRVPPVPSSGSVSTSVIWLKLGLSASRELILVCLTNLLTKNPPMPPKLNRRRAELVLSKIDAILAWEARHENERDTRFVELGKYLCEVRAGQYWRMEKLKSFDEFLERRFPESRRKAYYLMSIHEQLPPQVRKELKQVGWAKGLELAKLARQQGQRFESATWLHKARQMPKAEFQREVEKELTGKDSEPSELIYFKVYKSQIPVIEQAIETAALMLGSDKSRGYCLEMICADFLAGAAIDGGNPEILLQSISRYYRFLPSPQQETFLSGLNQKAS
jgi:hypothetical protein